MCTLPKPMGHQWESKIWASQKYVVSFNAQKLCETSQLPRAPGKSHEAFHWQISHGTWSCSEKNMTTMTLLTGQWPKGAVQSCRIFFLNAWELWSYPLIMVIYTTPKMVPRSIPWSIIISMKIATWVYSSFSHKIRGNYTIYVQVVGSIPMSIPVYSIMYVLKWHRLYSFICIFPSYPMICIMKW